MKWTSGTSKVVEVVQVGVEVKANGCKNTESTVGPQTPGKTLRVRHDLISNKQHVRANQNEHPHDGKVGRRY